MIFALSLEGHLLVEHDGRFQNNPFCSSFFKYVLCHYLGSDFFHGCVSVSLFCFVVFFVIVSVFFHYCFRVLSLLCFRLLLFIVLLLFPFSFVNLFPFSFITSVAFSFIAVSVFSHYCFRFLTSFKFSRLCFQFSLIPLLPFSLVSRGRSCPVYTARDGHFIARFNCKSIKMCLLLLQNPLSWCIHVHLSFFYAVFLRFIYFYCYCPNSLIFSASIIRSIVDIRYIASRSIIKR